jgi:predicted nucleotide-binding protein
MTAELAERIRLGEEIRDRQVRSDSDLDQMRADYYTWEEVSERLLRSRFTTGKVADGFRPVAYLGSGARSSLQEEWTRTKEDVTRQLRKLYSITQQLDLYELEVEPVAAQVGVPGTKVFIVHGHDGDTKQQVATFLEKILGKRPIILHEQPNRGRTIIEKFEDHAAEIGFAVVLLTADDVGAAKDEPTNKPRARQNVVFEHGFFVAKLGRSRVVAIHEEGVELPSDLSGVLYHPLAGNWQMDLARELKAAGISVDLSAAL